MFAHSKGIAHGHLRPTNILFTDTGKVKLTDFMLQDDVSDVKNAHYYRLEDECRTKAADLYSTGVLLYQLFTGCLPRHDGDDGFVVRKLFIHLPQDLQELIKNMLSTMPHQRHKESLQQAVALFDIYSGDNRNTLCIKDAQPEIINEHAPIVYNTVVNTAGALTEHME